MDMQDRQRAFFNELSRCGARVRDYLRAQDFAAQFAPGHLRDSVYSYLNLGGKSLRPAVLLFSCGAVGGDEERALPAAAGVEVFHTFTLIHDDIIDQDQKRRGGPTVHYEFYEKAVYEWGLSEDDGRHYGLTIGILAGDILHDWAISLLADLSRYGLTPQVALYLIQNLVGRVANTLFEGQTLDVQYSKRPVESLSEDIILDMLWKKTGVLYEFAGRAGAMIGLNTPSPDHPLVRAIAAFSSKCGTAFQLQDDILGIIGDETQLGKPIGSDVREGKRTTIVYFALRRAEGRQRRRLLETLGNRQATDGDVAEARALLLDLGAIEQTQRLARRYVEEAVAHLSPVPASYFKDLLLTWADYMISRHF